jgi:transposase
LLDRKQINVMRGSLKHWCVCVMRSKVEAMKEVAGLSAIKTVIFLIAGKLDFRAINPHARQPT